VKLLLIYFAPFKEHRIEVGINYLFKDSLIRTGGPFKAGFGLSGAVKKNL
jgi:hypothetical protein